MLSVLHCIDDYFIGTQAQFYHYAHVHIPQLYLTVSFRVQINPITLSIIDFNLLT
jgi:hypothetical protein